MEYLGWTSRRELWVEPDPRASLALGALGAVLALVGLLTSAPAEPAPDETVPSVEIAASAEAHPAARQAAARGAPRAR